MGTCVNISQKTAWSRTNVTLWYVDLLGNNGLHLTLANLKCTQVARGLSYLHGKKMVSLS